MTRQFPVHKTTNIPILSRVDLEEIAEEFLSRYASQCLKESHITPLFDIVNSFLPNH